MLYKLNWWKHVKTGLVYFFSPHPLISNFQLKQSLGLNSLRTVYTNGELSQDLYSKNSAKFEGRCISHNSIFPWTCRLFHHKKNKPQRIFNDAISNRNLNRISSTIILLRKQFLWAQGAIYVRFCSLFAMIINFLFFLQK